MPAPSFTARSLPDLIAGQSGWRRAATAFSAGVLSVLAMAPLFLSPILFLTMPVLVWLLDGTGRRDGGDAQSRSDMLRTARSAALVGWWFGFGFFIVGLYWIGEAFLVEAEVFLWLLPFAVTLLPAGLAIFFALAAAVARLFWWPGLSRILVLAVALGLSEWLRGHVLTGFPWNTLGYALTYPLPLMQTASVLGIYGLTLWTVLIFAAPLTLWADRSDRPSPASLLVTISVALVPLAVLTAGGVYILKRNPQAIDDGAIVRIVQPSIPQREKWQPEKQAANFAIHLDLSRHGPSGQQDDLAGITHVIWPEAAMPFLPLDHPEALAAIGSLLGSKAYLIAGALRLQRPVAAGGGQRQVFNSLMAFGPGGRLQSIYDKIHLVPFGEYLPFQQTLESVGLQQLTRLRGGFDAGISPRPLLSIPGLPAVSGLICYEGIFPTEIWRGGERPGLLLNLTNDGWFGESIGPHQHFHQSRVRAVEQGLPLIRAANNGISAIIDAQGRVLARLELNQRGVIDTGIPRPGIRTIYARYGESTFAVLVLLFLGWAGFLRYPAGQRAGDQP